MEKNIRRAKVELQQVPDSTYYEGLVHRRLVSVVKQIGEEMQIIRDAKVSSNDAQFGKLLEDVLKLKQDGYIALLKLAEIVEKYLTAQVNNLVSGEINPQMLEDAISQLIIHPYQQTDTLHVTSPTADNDLANVQAKVKSNKGAAVESKYKPSFITGGAGNWDTLRIEIERRRGDVEKLTCYDHFVRVFSLVCKDCTNNDDIFNFNPAVIQRFIKQYVLASTVFVNTSHVTSTPNGLQAMDTFVSLSMQDKSCAIHVLQKDLDELFCCIQKAMCQKVLSVLGLYRTYVMKRIDMQFPRLIYGGHSQVFTQYESEVEQIPTEVEVPSEARTYSNEQFETYYRSILLCEYYADFFARQQSDGNEYLLFMKPMNDSSIGNLLAFFFDMRKRSPTFQYTAETLGRIIAKLQHIIDKPHPSLDVYGQIVLYVNQCYGLIPKSHLDQLSNVQPNTSDKTLYYIKDNAYHTVESMLATKGAEDDQR
jgi:hypothetical protein